MRVEYLNFGYFFVCVAFGTIFALYVMNGDFTR